MVLGGARNKGKSNPNSTAQQMKGSVKKAQFSSATSATSESNTEGKGKQRLLKGMKSAASLRNMDTDSEEEDLSNTPQIATLSKTVPSELLSQFEKMLNKALKRTSEQITTSLTKEIRDLGCRTETLEAKMDEIEIYTQDCQSELDALKEENLVLHSKLEDFENRARRSNLRFRGIPETVLDLSGTILALCQELVPGLPVERLEFDRIHRALAPKKSEGPPRDIIAKFHYYRTKEQVLEAAREKSSLTFQGNNFQIFADLSQLTITKWRAMKPLLVELQQRNIKYQWGFPFSLRFTFQGSKIVCRSPDQLHQALIDLKLIDHSITHNSSRRRSASASSRNGIIQPEKNNGTHHTNKRGRFVSQPQDQEDTMD